MRRDDFKMRALPQPHGGGKVADDEGNRLAEVSIGRIADKPGPRISVCGDDHGSSLAKRLFANSVAAPACLNLSRPIEIRIGRPVRASRPITGSMLPALRFAPMPPST